MEAYKNVNLVPDKPAPKKCVKCKKDLTDYQKQFTRYCDECSEKKAQEEPGHAMYSTQHLHLQYLVDDNGMIWEGMPDNPDPYTSFDRLPIVRYHPDPELYRELKISHLLQQISVIRERKPDFNCFICNATHVTQR